MKNIFAVVVVFMLLSPALIAGGQQETDSAGAMYADGVYFAQEEQFGKTGWKYNVTLEVKDGEFTAVSWNSANVNAGKDKLTMSMDGEYGMVEKGDAMAPWYEQGKKVEAHFLSTQDTTKPDAISGASIGLDPFYTLVNKALAAGPVGYGPYKDGMYKAELPEFSNGYKYFVELTVTSGYIVSANWDAVAQDGGTNKAQRSEEGEYGMVENSDATVPWFEQSRKVEDYLLMSQNTEQPDAISGASIGLEPFYGLVNEALAGAMR